MLKKEHVFALKLEHSDDRLLLSLKTDPLVIKISTFMPLVINKDLVKIETDNLSNNDTILITKGILIKMDLWIHRSN